MDATVADIKQKRITDKFEVIRLLMERAEVLGLSGEEKKKAVTDAYVRIASADDGVYKMIPVAEISLIIEAFIYATKTVIAVNKQTGFLNKIANWFKTKFSKK